MHVATCLDREILPDLLHWQPVVVLEDILTNQCLANVVTVHTTAVLALPRSEIEYWELRNYSVHAI